MSLKKNRNTSITVSPEFHAELKLMKAATGERSYESLLKRMISYAERYQKLANLTRIKLLDRGGVKIE